MMAGPKASTASVRTRGGREQQHVGVAGDERLTLTRGRRRLDEIIDTAHERTPTNVDKKNLASDPLPNSFDFVRIISSRDTE